MADDQNMQHRPMADPRPGGVAAPTEMAPRGASAPAAVVENPGKPSMDDALGSLDLMNPIDASTGATSTGTGPGAASTGGAVMVPFDGDGEEMDPIDAPPPTIGEPPSLDAADDPSGGDVGDGYLRLTVRLEDGALSVTGARIVDGPLLQPDPTGELFYQAVVGDRRVGVGGLPDLQREHGFAPEHEPTAGHAMGPMDGADFVVRIPRHDITEAELADVAIELVRPSETTAALGPSATLQAEASAAGTPEPEVVARLDGVDLAMTSPEQAEAVRRRLR